MEKNALFFRLFHRNDTTSKIALLWGVGPINFPKKNESGKKAWWSHVKFSIFSLSPVLIDDGVIVPSDTIIYRNNGENVNLKTTILCRKFDGKSSVHRDFCRCEKFPTFFRSIFPRIDRLYAKSWKILTLAR